MFLLGSYCVILRLENDWKFFTWKFFMQKFRFLVRLKLIQIMHGRNIWLRTFAVVLKSFSSKPKPCPVSVSLIVYMYPNSLCSWLPGWDHPLTPSIPPCLLESLTCVPGQKRFRFHYNELRTVCTMCCWPSTEGYQISAMRWWHGQSPRHWLQWGGKVLGKRRAVS